MRGQELPQRGIQFLTIRFLSQLFAQPRCNVSFPFDNVNVVLGLRHLALVLLRLVQIVYLDVGVTSYSGPDRDRDREIENVERLFAKQNN